MAQPKTLTQIQLDVLKWIEQGCPDEIMDGYTHRITAAALRNRGLVTTRGRGPTWVAEITDDGRSLLAELAGPRAPKLRKPNGSATQRFIDELIAAGGTLTVDQPSWSQRIDGAVDPEQRAKAAHTHRKVPTGCWLSVTRPSSSEVTIQLRRPPDGWPAIDGPVPVPGRITATHPAVRDLKAKTDRHEVSRAQLGRTLRIIQGVANEAERRGSTVRTAPDATDNYGRHHWTGPNQGHIIITNPDVTTAIRICEIGIPSRAFWEKQARYAAWRSPRSSRTLDLADYEKDATGRLCIEIVSYGFGSIRPSRWSDNKRGSLEDQLSEVLFEIGIRAIEAHEHELEKQRAEEDRQRRWQAAMVTAEERYLDNLRAETLLDQTKRWSEAQQIREFCDATIRTHPTDTDVADWVTWSRSYADRLDPLHSETPTGPELPKTIPPQALVPHLDGWSPYGPR